MEATGQKGGLKAKVQRLGSHLSGMVMPNIGGFIAWGLSPLYLSQMDIFQMNNLLH